MLRKGGRIAFSTIELAPALTGAARRRARDAGPRAAATRRPYADLLASAGFVDVRSGDLTAPYRATTAAWLRETEARRDELVAVDGEDVVAERLAKWRDALEALDAGLLRRSLYRAQRG